jgi:hypothetical protein
MNLRPTSQRKTDITYRTRTYSEKKCQPISEQHQPSNVKHNQTTSGQKGQPNYQQNHQSNFGQKYQPSSEQKHQHISEQLPRTLSIFKWLIFLGNRMTTS